MAPLICPKLFHIELPDNSLSKGFPWACGRSGWETRITHLLNGGLSIWVRILTNRFTDVLGPGWGWCSDHWFQRVCSGGSGNCPGAVSACPWDRRNLGPSHVGCLNIWALLLKWLTCVERWYLLSRYTNLITLVFWDSLSLYWYKRIINVGYIHIIRGKFLWLHDEMLAKTQTLWDLWKSAVCAEKNQ